MEFNVFMGYLEKGIASVLNGFEYDKYPSNSLHQNNSAQPMVFTV